MPGHGPEGYPVVTYVWVVALSIWGGVVSFYRKIKSGHARPFNIIEFVGEIATSALVGLITFYLAESANIDQVMTAALVAISGHMGSRLLFQFERLAEAKLGTRSLDDGE